MPDPVQIRLAEPKDATFLAALNRDFNDSATTPEQIARQLQEGTGTEVILVAEINGRVVGFACMQMMTSICYPNPWAELSELYVHPSHRRCGLGRALLQKAEDQTRSWGAREIHLRTGAKNAAGKALYRTMGYCEDPEILFQKRLRDLLESRE